MPNPDGTLTQAEWYAATYPNYSASTMPANQIGGAFNQFIADRSPNPSDPNSWAFRPNIPAFPSYPGYMGAAAPVMGPPAPPIGYGGASVMPQNPVNLFPVPNMNVLPQGYQFGQFGQQGTLAKTHGGPGVKGGTSPATSPGAGPNNPLGAGFNNPNEPGAMANQYDKSAIDKARPPIVQTKPQGDTWIDGKGNKRHKDPKIDYAYQNIDSEVGKGFTDRFMSLHGIDPITFYARQFASDPRAKGWELPGELGDQGRGWLMSKAAYAATSDAKFLPGAVEEWQRVHGNTEIPQEQWERWSSISQATGGNPMNTGVGENPWGVY